MFNRLFIIGCSCMLLVLWRVAIAETPTITIPDSRLLEKTTEKPAPKPYISGHAPAGCVEKGRKFTVLGKSFGSSKGKSVAVAGKGIHVDLRLSGWSDRRITLVLPDDARIVEGKSYFIGVEKTDHRTWLSNIDKHVAICRSKEDTAKTKPPPIIIDEVRKPEPDGGLGDEPAPEDDIPPDPGGGGGLNAPLPAPPQAPPVVRQDPDTVEPDEIVAMSADMDSAMALESGAGALGFSVKRRRGLGNLGLVISTLRIPRDMSVGEALTLLREQFPDGWLDANHRYELMGMAQAKFYAKKRIGWGESLLGCGSNARIGLIDTGVNSSHPAFRGRRILSKSFLSRGVKPAAESHGTALAGLLVGAAGSAHPGLMPDAQLIVAEAFRERGKGKIDTTTESVVLALDWLVGQRVSVINLSFGSERNLALELALTRVLATGARAVAAGGNGGPKASPVYPAAQSGIIAVTAVDAELEPYRDATRGSYIDFAAPGVDVWAATPGAGGAYVSGTSYATPFVIATLISHNDPRSPGAALRVDIDQLGKYVEDLGVSGKDPIFGWGLLRAYPGCS
jgi:hypothetical protein